jgi:hypothetical protein
VQGDDGNVLRLSPSEMHLHAAFPNARTLGWKYQKFLLHASKQAQAASGTSSSLSFAETISSIFFTPSPKQEES